MAQLVVRNLEDELVAKLKLRAAKVRAMTAGRPQTPSEILLREGRDER